MAIYKAECGKDSCLCSFLFLDFELAKAWLQTARQYAGYAMKPHKDIVCKQLLQPWKLSTLQEHDACFQQWSILQLWIGIITTLVIFVIHFIWFVTEDNVPFGAIILNAIFRLALTVFFAHLVWFGVVNKHGCCCFLMCCCEGPPNLLVVSVLSVIFGILALITALQAVFSGFLLAILGAIFAIVHGLSMFYLGFEAFMIWRHSTSGDAPTVGKATEQDGKVAPRSQSTQHAPTLLVEASSKKQAAHIGRDAGDLEKQLTLVSWDVTETEKVSVPGAVNEAVGQPEVVGAATVVQAKAAWPFDASDTKAEA